jgi:hypothetical protein
MVRVMVVVLALAALVLSVGLAGAQMPNAGGITGALKNVVPGGADKSAAPKGGGMMDRFKGMIPDAKKDAAAKECAAGDMAKAPGPGAVETPAAEKKCGGMMDKVKGIIPGGEKE